MRRATIVALGLLLGTACQSPAVVMQEGPGATTTPAPSPSGEATSQHYHHHHTNEAHHREMHRMYQRERRLRYFAERRYERLKRMYRASRGRDGSYSNGWYVTQASWYEGAGNRGSCGYGMRRGQLYTAHRSLPCGTSITVRGPDGTVVVRVMDRGPNVRGRALDLSPTAFRRVCGSTRSGVCKVRFRSGNPA